MSGWELFYFAFKDSTVLPLYGRGEAIRILFRLNGVSFKETELSMEQHLERKAKGDWPFGTIPVVKKDGKQIAQMAAICYAITKETGSFPEGGDWDVATALSIVTAGEDVFVKVVDGLFCEEGKKAEALEANLKIFAAAAKNFERFLESNGTGWFVGSSPSFADVHHWNLWDHIRMYTKKSFEELLADTPRLLQFVKAFPQLRPIKDYIASRK